MGFDISNLPTRDEFAALSYVERQELVALLPLSAQDEISQAGFTPDYDAFVAAAKSAADAQQAQGTAWRNHFASYGSASDFTARHLSGSAPRLDSAPQSPSVVLDAAALRVDRGYVDPLTHLKSIFVDDYYPRTLEALNDLLEPVTYADPDTGTKTTIPNYVRVLLTVYVQTLGDRSEATGGLLTAALREIGVPDAGLTTMSLSCAKECRLLLSRMLGVSGGVSLLDSPQYKAFSASLKRTPSLSPRFGTALASVDPSILSAVDGLFARNTAELTASEWSARATESSVAIRALNGFQSLGITLNVDGADFQPFAGIRDRIVAQKEAVTASMTRIRFMQNPADVAHLVKSFEADIDDVHWIYDQLRVPKDARTGTYLVDRIYDDLDFMDGNGRDVFHPPEPYPGIPGDQWKLCLGIALEKKKIDCEEVAWQAVAVAGSIAAVIAGATVAGPPGGMIAGGVVAAATSGHDVYRTQNGLNDVEPANAAHRLAGLPIADNEHVELVTEERNYAVAAAVANTLLALVGGAANPALGTLAETLVPGKTLSQVTLRMLLNSGLQGGYGATDGVLSAACDGRQTDQTYLDRVHAKSGAQGEAPRAMTALVYSGVLGGIAGAGSEILFGSGKFEILCALDGKGPTIVDAVTGKILKGLRVSADGSRLIAPDGTEAAIHVDGKPRAVVRDADGIGVAGDDVRLDPGDPDDVWRVLDRGDTSGVALLEKTEVKYVDAVDVSTTKPPDDVETVMYDGPEDALNVRPGYKIPDMEGGGDWTVVSVTDWGDEKKVVLSRTKTRQMPAQSFREELASGNVTAFPNPSHVGWLREKLDGLFKLYAVSRNIVRSDTAVARVGADNVSVRPKDDGLPVDVDYHLETVSSYRYEVTVKRPDGSEHVISVDVAIDENGRALQTPEQIRDIVAAMPEAYIGSCAKMRFDSNPYAYQEAAATAGDGRITFYPCYHEEDAASRQNIDWHELGHLIAETHYGRFVPDQEWNRAIQADAAVISDYAHVNMMEDFAETVMLYVMSDGGRLDPTMRKNFTARFAILDKIFDVHPEVRTEVEALIRAFLRGAALVGAGSFIVLAPDETGSPDFDAPVEVVVN